MNVGVSVASAATVSFGFPVNGWPKPSASQRESPIKISADLDGTDRFG